MVGEKESGQEKRLREWEEAAGAHEGGKKRNKKAEEDKQREQKYVRGTKIPVRKEKNSTLKNKIRYQEKLIKDAVEGTAKLEKWLLPGGAGYIEAEEGEATYNYSQREIVDEVEMGAARKVFDLKLTQLGGYKVDFTRNGRHMVIGGRKGHLAELDWQRGKLLAEINVRETVRDVCFLHNHMFWAAAQQQFVFIYSQNGEELHCLRDHQRPYCLEFLPYHFLLCSIGDRGVICWQDTSTGRMVSRCKTRKGPSRVMRHNPWNAVLCVGHDLGSVTMWTPNQREPVVRMLCHKGPVRSLAIDLSGNYLVTAGAERTVKVWDVRKYQELQSYSVQGATESLDISQQGMLAVSHSDKIEVWRGVLGDKQDAPYLRHKVLLGGVNNVSFCPYEDVLGIGHANGVSTMLVPGAGEPNFDSLVANPFQTKDGRKELEVHQLLDKIQPELIALDPTAVGKVKKSVNTVPKDEELVEISDSDTDADEGRNIPDEAENLKPKRKTKMKGKNKPSRVQGKKQSENIRANILKGKKEREEASARVENEEEGKKNEAVPDGVPFALRRFYQ